MLKQIDIKTIRLNKDYISEIKVIDDETNELFYVVVQIGNVLYKTFKSSYIDYLKGKTTIEPVLVEGEDYLWFDYKSDVVDTIFFEFYSKALKEAFLLLFNTYIKHKHAHLKKPVGNIKYQIVNKRKIGNIYRGNPGATYEIKFHLIEEDKDIYVTYHNIGRFYTITNYSDIDDVFDENKTNKLEDIIEVIDSFKKAKKSKYYDLYLELEKYKDGHQTDGIIINKEVN